MQRYGDLRGKWSLPPIIIRLKMINGNLYFRKIASIPLYCSFAEMEHTTITALALILANIIFSFQGLKSQVFFDRYSFVVDKILIEKDYKRLITSSFLHVSWSHLFFNMISLYLFSSGIEQDLGEGSFLLIYFGSLIGGDLFCLYIHRHHGDYSAVGASGAISGLIFASIALFPGIGIGFPGLPFHVPGWLYGLCYVLYSIYGIRSDKGNIGHEAHLGGALVGLCIALAIEPSALMCNYFPIILIIVPSAIFIYLIVTRPHILFVDNFFYKKHRYFSIDEKYNSEKVAKQNEVDRILEKIHQKGIESLTKNERQILDDFSKKK